MKLSEMREMLARREIQLTKSLGQNFLHDSHQLERIVQAGAVGRTDKILEIGPGLGPLTERLLDQAGQVLAIEKDGRLVEVLRERFAGKSHFELIHDDALEYLKREQRDWSGWKLVANLPYSVASPILVELAAGPRAPQRMTVTLQAEVAHRLMAGTDDEDYGVLTLLVQLDFLPRDCFKIPPGCFFPPPEVDSACVTLERRPEPLLSESKRKIFYRLVKLAFSQRRKMMLKLLKQDWPRELLESAFVRLNISPQERAEKLSLEQFVAMTQILAESRGQLSGKPDTGSEAHSAD